MKIRVKKKKEVDENLYEDIYNYRKEGKRNLVNEFKKMILGTIIPTTIL